MTTKRAFSPTILFDHFGSETLGSEPGGDTLSLNWQFLDENGRLVGERRETEIPEIRFAETIGEDGNLRFSPVGEPVLLDVADNPEASSILLSIADGSFVVDLHRWNEKEGSDDIRTGVVGPQESTLLPIIVVSDGYEKVEDFEAVVSQWYRHCLDQRPFNHTAFADRLSFRWIFRETEEGKTSLAVTQSSSIDRVFSGSTSLVRKLLEKSAIGFDAGMHVLVLSNLALEDSRGAGGAGGAATGQRRTWKPAWTLSRSTHWLQTATHELGHAFGLADEYHFPNCGGGAYRNIYLPDPLLNVSETSEASSLPTPWQFMLTRKPRENWARLYDYPEEVAAFEGAKYCSKGWFRPSENCLMKSIAKDARFCPVCSELIGARLSGA